MVLLFEPRWGAMGPDGLFRRGWEDMVFGRPVVSWMLFLSHAYGPIGALPPPAKVEAVRDGEVVWSTAEWFDDSPEHDDAWQTLEQYLDSRGQRPPAVPTE